MKPIEIRITGKTTSSAQEICAQLVDTERWSDFKGYALLPGIRSAKFESKYENMVGSRIKVHNTDGSSHVEEILEWDPDRKVVLKFQEFDSPLKFLASHFIEVWDFQSTAHGTMIARSMLLYPKNFLGWAFLFPISRLMKKAFELNQAQLGD